MCVCVCVCDRRSVTTRDTAEGQGDILKWVPMRKEYGTAVRALFADALVAACPDFAPVKMVVALAAYPGERPFRWTISTTTHAWIVLVPDLKREGFTVEIGWSRLGRFPQLTARPSSARPHDAGPCAEYLGRLGEVAGGSDRWWILEDLPLDANAEQMMAHLIAMTTPIPPDVARARAAPLVGEAVAEIVRSGIPFLRTHLLPP